MSMDNPRTHAEREAAPLNPSNAVGIEAVLQGILCGSEANPCTCDCHRRTARCLDCSQHMTHPEREAAQRADEAEVYGTPKHTHPCPTCHHARSCTCTTFVPGKPLECATCSNCRGW